MVAIAIASTGSARIRDRGAARIGVDVPGGGALLLCQEEANKEHRERIATSAGHHAGAAAAATRQGEEKMRVLCIVGLRLWGCIIVGLKFTLR